MLVWEEKVTLIAFDLEHLGQGHLQGQDFKERAYFYSILVHRRVFPAG